MQLTFSHYEEPAVLTAAAAFLTTLAAIAVERDKQAATEFRDNVVAMQDTLAGANALVPNPDVIADRGAYINALAEASAALPPEYSENAIPGAAGLAAGGISDSNMLGTGRVDMKGVAFNPDYCSEAKDPFYSSGPNQGQWKCRRGVPGATYDHWYANELAAITLTAGGAEPGPVDVAAAFGPATTAAPAITNTAAPTDCGKLMVWVSEQQVAGNITPEQVQNAYSRHNLTLADMFPPNTPDVIAQRVALIYGDLA